MDLHLQAGANARARGARRGGAARSLRDPGPLPEHSRSFDKTVYSMILEGSIGQSLDLSAVKSVYVRMHVPAEHIVGGQRAALEIQVHSRTF